MNDYAAAFKSFEEMISEGVEIEHSAQNQITVYTTQDYYDADEIQAEENFSNWLDGSGLECLISLEEALEVTDWDEWEDENLPSKYERLEIVIDEFNHDAIKNDTSGEVIRQLENIIKVIKDYGVQHLDGSILKDSNGNSIGNIDVYMA